MRLLRGYGTGPRAAATGEILTGKSGLPELDLLLTASSPVGPVTPPRSEPLHRWWRTSHSVTWLLNHCFRGKKWRGNIHLRKLF